LRKDLGWYHLQTINTDYDLLPWKRVVYKEEINSHLNRLGSYQDFLHSDHNPMEGPYYHGNPIKG